jgi:hypothetical protein
MTPLYGDPGCPHCRFLDTFGGADWYLCTGGHTPQIVSHWSREPHDVQSFTLNHPPSGGLWKRAYLLAKDRGMIPEKGSP